MKVAYVAEVDEKQTTLSREELLQMGLDALASVYSKTGAYFDVGYNPMWVTDGGCN